MKENFIGAIGNKYSIILEKNGGGYGKIYLVKDNKTNKEYAAKILEKDKNFLSEVEINKTLKELKIPNIAEYIDSGIEKITFKNKETEEKKFLIFEYYSKRDLLSYISFSFKGLKETFSKVLFKKVLETIQQIHKCGIYHLDLKLNNILLDDKYNPKITDFGLSKTIKESINNKFCCRLGTIYFWPPQMHLKQPFDGSKADIFCLGISLFVLVTYEIPFTKAIEKDEAYNLIKNHKYDDYWEKITKKNKNIEVSDEFKKLFVKMVDFEEKERPDIETILSDKWFDEIRDLNDEQKIQLEKDYISEFTKIEIKMNEQLNQTKEAKSKGKTNESLNKE